MSWQMANAIDFALLNTKIMWKRKVKGERKICLMRYAQVISMNFASTLGQSKISRNPAENHLIIFQCSRLLRIFTYVLNS